MNWIIYKLGIKLGWRFRQWYYKKYKIWRWGLMGWVYDSTDRDKNYSRPY